MQTQNLPISIEAVECELARRDLASYCMHVDPSYQVARHHRKLIDALEKVERGEIKRLIVSMPPRHGKSLTTTIRFPAWYLGRNQHKRVILASYADDLAYTFSRSCRNELAEHGESVFQARIAKDSSAVGTWNLEGKRGGLSAAGVGGPITGKGCSLMIIDDPVKDAEQADSEVVRKKVIEWWQSVARTRLAPGGAVVLVMTRWHEDDLAGFLLKEAQRGGEAWTELVLPMVDDSDGQECDAEGNVKLLWPEWFGSDFPDAGALARFKVTLGTRTWEALYQQRPAANEGNRFKRHWLRFYKPYGAHESWKPLHPRPKGSNTLPTVELPKEFDEVWESWDMTFKDTKGSDYVCGGKWGRKGSNKYLLAIYHKQASFTDTLKAVLEMRREEPYAGEVLIEDKANGPAVINAIGGKVSGLIPIEPMGSKEARASSVEPQFEAGNVFLPEGAEWVSGMVDELASFPRAKHDDWVDMCSQALIRVAEDSDLAYAKAMTGG